ncbi:response regulator [Sphingomonas sp. PL-96]|uniref:response regulator n=1 Tax=Sphingomonas sp. PL-96 TaxID=2887201 RepID=UPI001E552668|nr:response regulator [Sphingomonas sp. PL-96]MCC2976634.1 response regulator [Sphingomonas sp. PL-96]
MCHVLIIEDDWFIVEYLTELAEEAGATSIARAATEGDAISAAREKLPGIILSDVNLLTGTGPRAVEAIIARAGPIPVIFITGTPEDCAPCEPPSVILGKPINHQQVVNTFRQLAPV